MGGGAVDRFSASADRGALDAKVKRLLTQSALSRDEVDMVIVELHAKFGDAICRRLRLRIRRMRGGSGGFDENDVLQEMWWKAAREFAKGGARDVENLRAWLYKISHRCLVDYMRSRERQTRAQSHLLDVERVRVHPFPADELVAREEHEELRQALEQLDHDERTILLSRYNDDLSSSEIGMNLGIPASTVRGTAHRALERLRALLACGCGNAAR
jgi:RNA polymerase sigma-70 factor (ECF subfamily)